MKKIIPFIVLLSVFFSAFIFLHQKIQIYVEAYQLSKQYQQYKELVDKRDYFRYNLNKHVTLAKVQQWALNNEFTVVNNEDVEVLTVDSVAPQRPEKQHRFAALLNRVVDLSSNISQALAGER